MTFTEALHWLDQPPDASGECDRCHDSPCSLWQLPQCIDTEPESHWSYCRACYAHIIGARRKKFTAR